MLEWFDYVQIATLILSALLVAGKAVHLWLTQHINPIAIGAGKNGWQKLLEFGFAVGMALWLVTMLSFVLHFEERVFPAFVNKPLLEGSVVKLAGLVLLICGLVIFALALISFGNSWRVGIDKKAPGELVSHGIFSISRNPIFLALVLYASGTFLINGQMILLLFAVAIAVGVHYQILQEEAFLLQQYGRAYQDYCARTGRYITFRTKAR